MLETLLAQLEAIDPIWIYLIVVFFAFIENLFPPSPSDVVVIVGASGLSAAEWSYIPLVLAVSLSSALGFMAMYLIGTYLGDRVLRRGRVKLFSREALDRSERWFGRYGYWFIAANRFLPGTRSAISLASGVLKTEPGRTFGCALFSALLWNSLIIYLGMLLGANVDVIDRCLSAYHRLIILLTAVVVLVLLVRLVVQRKRQSTAGY